ncbi:MAG: response regulator, partial [Nitrososphaeraceae archaeon]|nr:response regulator [Nitrososphaeraceae archaeon]
FADAACFLSQNRHFDECEILEWWSNETTTEWKQNNLNITVVCPHPGQILKNPLLSETMLHIGSMHTITIDFNYNINIKKHYDYNIQKNPKYQHYQNKKKTKRILIVEPEPDIQYIYSLVTKQYGFEESDINIVKDGTKCLEVIFSAKDDNNNDYDLIIIDTHLRDISGFEVARKIRNRLPHKRIILTTTYSLDNIINMINSIGIKPKDVVLKPFNFAELIALIEGR